MVVPDYIKKEKEKYLKKKHGDELQNEINNRKEILKIKQMAS